MARLLVFIILIVPMALLARYQPGGEFSSNDWSQEAFNHPVSNAPFIEKQFFGVGNSFFKQAWVEFPSSTIGRDGLGPTFNAVSCAACHVRDGRGSAYDHGEVSLSMLFRLSQKLDGEIESHPEYGDQFQPLGISTVQGEGDPKVQFEYFSGTFADGTQYELRKPTFHFENLKHSAMDDNTLVSARVAPHLVGLGFIEAVDPEDLLLFADPDDLNQDGISGRPNFVKDIESGQIRVGLFGWKAGQPSLKQQVAAAFIGDMGLTSSLFVEQNCPLVQLDCLDAPIDPSVEVSDKVLKRVTTYSQLIAVPHSRNDESPEFAQGRQIFAELKCTACHRATLQTSDFHEQEALHNQTIHPYSDFLLHDMGEGLSDNRPEGEANGQEWRTPPLWSLGLIPLINRHSNLLHDGRARNIEEAILWHGGEAQMAKEAFIQTKKLKRDLLINFIESL